MRQMSGVARFLESLRGQKTFVEASALQRASVENKLSNMKLDIDEARLVVEAASKVAWHTSDLDAVLQAITACASGSAGEGAACRTQLQNFANCFNYGTAAFWKAEITMDSVVTLLYVLGCRNPTEPTVQSATAMLLLGAQGLHATLAMSSETALITFRGMKKAMKAKVKGPPATWIGILPANPCDYRAQFPNMYGAVYSESSGPVKCPFAASDMEMAIAHVPCRSSRRKERVELTRVPSIEQFSLVAQQLMQQFASMPVSRHATLDMMKPVGSSGASSSSFVQSPTIARQVSMAFEDTSPELALNTVPTERTPSCQRAPSVESACDEACDDAWQ